MTTTIRGTVRGMGTRANPAFAVGAVVAPLAALGYAVTVASVQQHTYVHVMAGVLWTGIDLFMAAVLGPVLGGLSVEERASVFERFTPKMTFLMPTLAMVTIFAGITLAPRVTNFPHAAFWTGLFAVGATVPPLLLIGWQFDAVRDRRWLAVLAVGTVASGGYLLSTLPDVGMTRPIFVAILAVMVVLTTVGFGLLMPGEVKIYLETRSADPDREKIGRIGMRNAKLAGVQGAFQLAIVALMVYLRFGGI